MRTNNTKLIVTAAVLLVTLLLILECVFKVKETEQVVVTQFGKPVGSAKTTPGLKLKMPWKNYKNRSDYYQSQRQMQHQIYQKRQGLFL